MTVPTPPVTLGKEPALSGDNHAISFTSAWLLPQHLEQNLLPPISIE